MLDVIAAAFAVEPADSYVWPHAEAHVDTKTLKSPISQSLEHGKKWATGCVFPSAMLQLLTQVDRPLTLRSARTFPGVQDIRCCGCTNHANS